MPRTQVPEEGQRVVNINELKNTKPRSEAVIRTEGESVTNDGLSNLYWWDPNGNPSNADGKTIIESNVSGYQNGEANEGVWRRMFKPSSEIESQIENSAGNQGAVQYSDGSGGFLGNTGYLYIDNSDGSVGVGTSSPAEDFSVDGNLGVKSGYLWVKNGNNAYVTGGMHVGGSSVPANALEISGNFTSSGWGGVNDKFSVNAPAPYGPNAVGIEELQVDGSVGADDYNFYHPESNWNIRPSGGQGNLLIHQNFGSNFSLIEARTRDVDVTDTSTDSEATLALTRSDSAETAVEFLDLYNNGYYSAGSVRHGLRVQKRGGGKLRNFEFEWDDGNNQYLGYSIKPPTDLTNGDGAKIHFNVPIGILTASPSYALDVNGDINAQGELRSSGNIVSPDSVSNAHHTRPSAGDGIVDNSNTFDVRLDLDQGGTNVASVYQINVGSGLNAIDDGGNQATVEHENTSGQSNVSTGGATVIDDINLDSYGHTTNINTENRRLSDWLVPTSALDISDEALQNVGSINIDDFTFDQDSGDLVLSDNNGVELIRQPKAGPTQFIQGAEIGSIEAPTDSFTQVINASSTSAAASGDLVGYTFAVDNQSILEVKADADGSGGITNKRVSFANGVEIGGVAGDGLVSSGGNLNVRLPITDGGSSVANVFQFNIGGALEALDDGGNQTTIRHFDTSSQGNVSTGGATVIDDINLDGYGHVTNMNTENRSLDDWAAANANLNLDGNGLYNVGNLNVSSINSNNGGNPVQVNQGLDMNSNAVTFGNFDVEYNSNSESLDFIYTG